MSADDKMPRVWIEREGLAFLAKDKTATTTVSSGLLTKPFGDKVALVPASALEAYEAKIAALTAERDALREAEQSRERAIDAAIAHVRGHFPGAADEFEAAMERAALRQEGKP